MAKEFTYKMNIDADIGALTNKLKTLKETLSSITSDGKEPRLAKVLEQLGTHLDNIKSKANTPIKSEAAFGAMEKEIQTVYRLLESLSEEMTAVSKKSASEKISFLPESEQKKLIAVVNAMKAYDNAIEASVKKTKELTKAEEQVIKDEATLEKRKVSLAKKEQSATSAVEAREKAEKDLQAAIDRRTKAEEKQKQLERGTKEIQGDKRSGTFVADDGREITLAKARAEAKAAANAAEADSIRDLEVALSAARSEETKTAKAVAAAATSVKEAETAYNNSTQKVKELTAAFDASKIKVSSDAFSTLKQQAKDLGVNLEGIGSENTIENIDLLKQRMEEFVVNGVEPANAAMQSSIQTTQEMTVATDQLADTTKKSTKEFKEQSEAAAEVNGLISRIKQFTGLTGAALVARRALHNAINTIKELDKQMTAMAVVTNLDVGDYWKQLPEHTERANALGMAIKDVYEAETLYYQQGLKTAEVTQLSTSTLKMARIAGLSAEDATNKMTAALRGFNMEINQTNADRIADVYSKLAAITASNVQEISSAMTKTASLAANAGMQFETTAAFLSQIIETTRESAETAGTALKTVIARFQELKKAPEEIGEVDGEIVDANKIETALRTVGVALRDTEGQFRNLDEVFLELASKWDGLDTNTQRYIATIAAGSRQQSRFIAMMSDYSRTQELVTAANTAAGASNEQFQKTLESLESKLAALKNAWDTFTMGIANSTLIKTGIDILTGILNTVNKITDAFGEWPGLAAKIGLVTAALWAGDKAVKAFVTSMSNGKGILTAFGAGLKAPINGLKNLGSQLKGGSKELKAYQVALEAQKKAQKATAEASNNVATALHNQRSAQLRVNNDTKQSTVLQQNLAKAKGEFAKAKDIEEAAKKEEIAANGALTASENALIASYKLSETQLTECNALRSAGVPIDAAAAMAKDGITVATYKEMTAEEQEALMQKYGNQETLKGSMLKAINAIQTNAVTGALYKLLPARIQDYITAKMQSGANLTLAGTFGILLLSILPIVIAIGVLIGLFFALKAAFKAIKASTPEGKLEATNEALKVATESATTAKEAFDGLKDSLKSLQEKYDALDELTVGTREWREALVEVNGQVLKLLDKYPELAKYVSNENGILRVSQEGMDVVLDKQADAVAMAQAAQYAAQINKNNASQNVKYSKLSNQAIGGDQANAIWRGIGTGALTGAIAGTSVSGVGGITAEATSREAGRKITDSLAKAMAEGQISVNENGKFDEGSLRKQMQDLGMSENDINEWIKTLGEQSGKAARELTKYGQALIENEEANRLATQGMINSAAAMVDSSKYTQEQITQMCNMGMDLMDKTTKEITQNLEKQGKAKTLDTNQEYLDYFEGIYGKGKVKISSTGEVQVKNDQDKWETKLGAETARSQYAAAASAEEMAKKMELLPTALSKVTAQMGKEVAKSFNKAFNDDQGAGLARADLKNLTKDYLDDIWKNNEELQEIYEDQAKFEEEIARRTKLAEQAFKQNQDKLIDLGLRGFEFNNTLTAGAEKGLIEHLSQVVAVSGEESAKLLGREINDLLETVAIEDRDKLAAQLNSIDWHDADALENLVNTLKEVGVNVPKQQLEDFIDNAKEAAHAIHTIDFTKLNEQLLTLSNTLSKIKSGEQQRIFDDESYQALIAADSSLLSKFTQNLDGSWSYIGASMDDLRIAIEKNTAAQIAEGTQQLENKIYGADVLDDIISEGNKKLKDGSTLAMANSGSWSEAEAREFVNMVVENARAHDYNLNGISDKLSTNTNALNDSLSKSDIQQIINDLRGIYQRQDEFRKQISTDAAEAWAKALQSNNVYRNAITDEASRAEEGKLDQDDRAKYQGARKALLSQGLTIGLTEKDIKRLAQINEEMIELEDTGKTTSERYTDLAKVMNSYMRIVSTTTGYQAMRTQMQDTIERNNELMETYKQTSEESEKMFLTKQMLQDFDIKVTEKNYEYLAGLTNDYLQGNEQGFITLINLAGQAAGIEANAFEQMAGKTVEEIRELGPIYEQFVDKMIDKGYGYWNEGKLIWGLSTMKDLVEKIVEATEKWKSPYDWLYNANQKINALMRQRNIYENEYQHMIEDGKASYSNIQDNIKTQIGLVQEEAEANKHLYDGAKASLERYMKTIESDSRLSKLQGAIAVGPAGQIVVDKEKLYSVNASEDEGGVYEEIIGEIEEQVDTLNDAADNLNDNVDTIRKLRDTGKDAYKDLLDRIKEALIQDRQKQIDKLSEINDSINDAQNKLIDKIQEQVDEQRRARDNQKTEQNITDKQARLAYLRASGGNTTEILKLQKEIANDQESYQDSLVDQTLNEMQKANDKAADQRQTQIEIAQAQLDYWSEYEAEHSAEQMLNQSIESIKTGTEPINTAMGNLLTKADNTEAMAEINKADWENNLGTNGNLASIYTDMNDETSEFGKMVNAAADNIQSSYEKVVDDYTSLVVGNQELLKQINTNFPSPEDWDVKITSWLEALEKIIKAGGPSGNNSLSSDINDYSKYNNDLTQFSTNDLHKTGSIAAAEYTETQKQLKTTTYANAQRVGEIKQNLNTNDTTYQAIQLLNRLKDGNTVGVNLVDSTVQNKVREIVRKASSQNYGAMSDIALALRTNKLSWSNIKNSMDAQEVSYYKDEVVAKKLDRRSPANKYITQDGNYISLKEDFFKDFVTKTGIDPTTDIGKNLINILKNSTKDWNANTMINQAGILATTTLAGEKLLSTMGLSKDTINEIQKELKAQIGVIGNNITQSFSSIIDAVESGTAEDIATQIKAYEATIDTANSSIENIEEIATEFGVNVSDTAANVEYAKAQYDAYITQLSDEAAEKIKIAYDEYTAALESGDEELIAKTEKAYNETVASQTQILSICGAVGNEVLKKLGSDSTTAKAEIDRIIQTTQNAKNTAINAINEARAQVESAKTAALQQQVSGIGDGSAITNSNSNNKDEMIKRFKNAMEDMEETLWDKGSGATLNEYGRDWRMMNGELQIYDSGKWVSAATYLKMIEQGLRTFAAGGLADFTGPAWLDGTKSAPELVLNATDTANFIELKDILSEILRGSHERAADAEGARGNNYYDIKVEVDSIDSDYGVDQAADRVRELIEEDAMYRNVTAVNKTR